MALAEAVLIAIGSSVAKTVLKLWLKDSELAKEVSLGLLDLLKAKMPDLLSRRRTERQFERIAEQVAEHFAEFLQREVSIPENEQAAAVSTVANTLSSVTLTSDILLSMDLDPLALEHHLTRADPSAKRDLSAGARGLYDKCLREACNYVIELSTALPDFRLASTREMLKREGEIIELVRMVLEAIPKPLASSADTTEDHAFEVQYRRELCRRLDKLELFGVTASEASRRYNLSIAYISLEAAAGTARSPIAGGPTSRVESAHNDRPPQDASGDATIGPDAGAHRAPLSTRVDSVVAKCRRAIVRGEAGSGKTTLLQWLAVRSARSDFQGSLAGWDQAIPFFVPLRRFAMADLPSPEIWPSQVTNTISGEMPRGWVHRHLRSGTALVLIDGVDELPEDRRSSAKEWLRQLTDTFPEARYVVTSRPAAIHEGWLESDGFEEFELLPMSISDVDAFIEHWHTAAIHGISDPVQLTEMAVLRDKLRGIVRENPPIRNLATSPLLCAMLCALNRDRKTQLPRDRLELYRIALEALLERRDVEREIQVEEAYRLSRREKEIILQDLAYWLLVNNRADIERSDVEKRIALKLTLLGRPNLSASKLLKIMLERSGILREPIMGRVDFVHRTFQEYLGAKAAVDDNAMGLLLEKATRDAWHEVIVLAAGHARPDQRETLINGLLSNARADVANRHGLQLLAVACLETSPELSLNLREALKEAVRALIPPRSLSEARSLASAGELAVPLLAGHSGRKVRTVSACVRALALIGGAGALEVLRQYGADARWTVVRELIRAWSYFDAKSFAQQVLAASPLENGQLTVQDETLVAGLPFLRALKALALADLRSPIDMEVLARIPNIESLHFWGSSRVITLLPLAQMAGLRNLGIGDCRPYSSIEPIGSLSQLKALYLANIKQETDLGPLAKLRDLTNLSLHGSLENCRNFAAISNLSELEDLALGGPMASDSLRYLDGMNELTSLRINSPNLDDLSLLKPMPQLLELDLGNCGGVTDVSAVAGMGSLRKLSLYDCKKLTDLGPLANLPELEYLNLYEANEAIDLRPLTEARRLRYVMVSSEAIKERAPDSIKRKVRVGWWHWGSLQYLEGLRPG